MQNLQEIRKLKDIYPVQFLFVSVTSIGSQLNEAGISMLSTESLTESEKHLVESSSQKNDSKLHSLREQLNRLGNFSYMNN